MAVDHHQMHVLAHTSYLLGQQIGEGWAIRSQVVIAALFVRQQRIRRFSSNVGVNVVLLEIRDGPVNHAMPFGRVQRGTFDHGVGYALRPGLTSPKRRSIKRKLD